MKTRIVQIGNSRGVRIPKHLLEAAGLQDEVELRADQNAIIISAPRQPRAGWAEASRQLAAAGEDQLLDDVGSLSQFDEDQWEWQ